MLNLTKEFLIQKYGDDVLPAINYVKTCGRPYPLRESSKPQLDHFHTTKDVTMYLELLKEHEKKIEIYDTVVKECKSVNQKFEGILVEYIKEVSGLNILVPEQYRDKVWEKAWSDGHSDGLYEVYNNLLSLVEIFED